MTIQIEGKHQISYTVCDEIFFDNGGITLQTRDGSINNLNAKDISSVTVFDYGVKLNQWVSKNNEFKEAKEVKKDF